MQPTVSAIIPYFRGEKWVDVAVDSIESQTYNNIEVIVVDDDPDGDLPANVKKRADIIKHRENKGIAEARNTGIKNSAGKYIAILDQDDVWYQDKIRRQVNKLENNSDLGAVFTNMDHIDESGEVTQQRKINTEWNQFAKEEKIKHILDPRCKLGIPYTSSMERAEVYEEVGGYNSELFGMNDKEFIVRLLDRFDAHIITDHLMAKRYHGNNTSGDTIKLLTDQKKFIKSYSERNGYLGREIDEFRAVTNLSLSYHNIRSGNIFSGAKHLIQSFVQSPSAAVDVVNSNWKDIANRHI